MITIHNDTLEEAEPKGKRVGIVVIASGVSPILNLIIDKLKEIISVTQKEPEPNQHPDLSELYKEYTVNDSPHYAYLEPSTYIYPIPYHNPCTTETTNQKAQDTGSERTVRPP